MRFGNGAHLDAEGVRIFSPAQVYFTNISADEVSLCLPAAPVLDRGNTLDGLNLTAKISAPYPEVLRVQLWHYMGIQRKGPAFPLAEPHAGNLKAEETEDLVIIRSGSLRLEIRKADAFFTFFRGEELLTSFGGRDAAYVKIDWRGKPYDYGSENAYMRQKLPLDVGELVYGLGERFGPFVKNGQTVDIWNADGGTSSDQAYKNVPFYVTNRGLFIEFLRSDRIGSASLRRRLCRSRCAECPPIGLFGVYASLRGSPLPIVLDRQWAGSSPDL